VRNRPVVNEDPKVRLLGRYRPLSRQRA